VGVDPGGADVAEGQARQGLEGVLGVDLAALQLLEQCSDAVAVHADSCAPVLTPAPAEASARSAGRRPGPGARITVSEGPDAG
jgi:hypothetical protein